MEKYARQAVSEGVTNSDDIRVGPESEILRVLNLHYNRNNHIDVSIRKLKIMVKILLIIDSWLCQTGSKSFSICCGANIERIL